MATSSMAALLTVLAAGAAGVNAAFKPPITNQVEHGVSTECKTCPYSLCTNTAFYESDNTVSLVCWTRGTVIDGDDTWLRTNDSCYVTQYDLQDYTAGTGDYTQDLSYCGTASEEEHLTKDDATVKYDTECNICPDNADCATIKYQSPGDDLTVLCWTDYGAYVIDDSTWLKTTDNCYVAEIGLEDKADRSVLDYCGPVGFLQVNYTGPPSSSSEDKRTPAVAAPIPVPDPVEEQGNDLHKRYLLNITVGEDYAYCHAKPNSTSQVQKKYPFDSKVWMQCYTSVDTTNANETWWYYTTDFCYVREVDFWESLSDQYRFPVCDHFTNPSKKRDARARPVRLD